MYNFLKKFIKKVCNLGHSSGGILCDYGEAKQLQQFPDNFGEKKRKYLNKCMTNQLIFISQQFF